MSPHKPMLGVNASLTLHLDAVCKSLSRKDSGLRGVTTRKEFGLGGFAFAAAVEAAVGVAAMCREAALASS